MKGENIMQILEAIIERDKADACIGCAFLDYEEWEMPCAKCRRGCKDYWRAKDE